MGKPTAASTDAATTPDEPALIVFGVDEAKKPHAAWFSQADAELAERAAGLMRMRVLRVDTAEHREVALTTAKGRIFESGKAFVPYARAALYERLGGFGEAFDPPAPEPLKIAPTEPAPAVTSVPTRWEDIDAGSLVLASEGATQGWFEAVATAIRGDDLVELRWRDWPEEKVVLRRRQDLALLRQDLGDAA